MNHLPRSTTAAIVHAFTFNRPLSLIVLVGIIVFGTLAYTFTPKQYNPEIIRPAFTIEIAYPGARADEVEALVTRELVEKVNDIPGVDEVIASSHDGGYAFVSVIFDVGRDIEETKVALYTRLMQSAPLAEGAMQQPLVSTLSPDDVPIITIALSSNGMVQHNVRTEAIRLSNTLKRTPGVANISIHGGEPRALRIFLSPEALRERNLTTTEVLQALTASNALAYSGTAEDNTHTISLRIDGTIHDASTARSVTILPGVELGDIARIEDAWSEQTSFVSFAQKDTPPQNTVFISIAKRAGENAPTVSAQVRATLEESFENDYEDLSYTIVRDDGLIAQKEIQGLGINLIQSIIIVGIVLLLFLSYRPALAVMTAIPLTLLLVFIAAFIAGETINRITLFALILSLGLLVDSATVVVENIYSHMHGTNADENDKAVVRAVEQVSLGLILSTVTSVVVFLPVAFITGMMGPYMGPLAFFVPMALIMSLVVAFVITPFVTFTLLRNHTDTQTKPLLDPLFARITKAYTLLLRRVLYNDTLKKKIMRMSWIVLLGAIALPMVGLVHFQMLPKADKNQFYIYIDLPIGSVLTETNRVAGHVSDTLHKDTTIHSTQLFVGEPAVVDFNGMFKGVAFRKNAHQATIRVNLVDSGQRAESSSDIVSRTRVALSTLTLPPGTAIKVLEDPPGPPVQATFVAKVFGPDTEVREALARTVANTATHTQGLVHVDTSIEEAGPQLNIRIHPERARESGVNAHAISETARILFTPVATTQYHLPHPTEYAPIEVSLPRTERTVASLDRVDVRSAQGTLVPLSSVAEYTWTRTIPSIQTENLVPVTYVTAETDNRSIVYAMIDVMRTLVSYTDDTGSITRWGLFGLTYTTHAGEDYHIMWGGEWEMTLENFRDLGLAMFVALFLVYGVLVAQYGLFRTPALIMTTIPFGLIGILPGFFILDLTYDVYLTATALIGFIALIGIVVNNAILYLEYVDELKEKDPTIDIREALIQAGTMRLRPIALTSLTTVLGSLTIAGDPVWSGLAWAIVFGLSLSTVLTLVLFPILYSGKEA